MNPDPAAIDEYIRANQARYTREAVRQQLVAAGHDPASIDAAWERVSASERAPRSTGWRPGWREFLVLLVLGTIGAAILWAGESYGAGVIAPVMYAIVLSIGFGAAKLTSILIDHGRSTTAAVLLAIAAVVGIYMTIINGPSLINVGVTAATGIAAVALFLFGNSNQRLFGMIGAVVPILIWLVVTGSCYAPQVRLPGG